MTARTIAAIGLSLCVHVLFGLWVRVSARVLHRESAQPVEISIVELAGREPRAAEPQPPPPPPPQTPPTPPVRTAANRRPRPPSQVAPPEQTAEQRPAPAPLPAEVQPPVPQPRAAAARPSVIPDLSPSAVASTWRDTGALEPTQKPASTTDRPVRTGKDVQAALDHHLTVVANDLPYARRRDPPKLTRRGDGNLWYEGTAFYAVITPDGLVKFSDIVFVEPLPPQMRNYPPGLAPEYIEVIKRIQELLTIDLPWPDLTDMIARINDDDPYAEEKRWFLRQTEDVRDKLADEYRAQETRRAKKRIFAELRGIVENAALSPDAKRAAVFAVWEMCAGDGGENWQGFVESFIREWMPQESQVGYAPEHLASLNRARTSPRTFAPYQERGTVQTEPMLGNSLDPRISPPP